MQQREEQGGCGKKLGLSQYTSAEPFSIRDIKSHVCEVKGGSCRFEFLQELMDVACFSTHFDYSDIKEQLETLIGPALVPRFPVYENFQFSDRSSFEDGEMDFEKSNFQEGDHAMVLIYWCPGRQQWQEVVSFPKLVAREAVYGDFGRYFQFLCGKHSWRLALLGIARLVRKTVGECLKISCRIISRK
jgi:hypothetical protein